MSAAFELQVLDLFDEALGWDESERADRLAEVAAHDPELAARVARLLQAEAGAAQSLPTIPASIPEAAQPLAPPERVGVYRLVRLLGEGGMGSVWMGARDDGLFAQSVAIKLIRPGLYAASAAAQFSAERRLLARLRHPAIAQLFDGGTDPEGRAYFIMEMVDGRPITDHVRDLKLTVRQVIPLFRALCDGVQHAHRNNVIHADIKPANILVDSEGRPKLLDFGIARGLEDEAATGQGLTPAYASPERRAGELPTQADDIYALGATLHELLTGTPPDSAPPRPLSPVEAGPELAAVIARATADMAEARYSSADELSEDLGRYLAGLPVRALPASTSRSLKLLTRRRPFAVGSALVAVIALVAALGIISALYLRAEAERREADARFGQSRGMAHYLLFDVFDGLTDIPGTIGLRRAVAERARFYLDELSSAPRAPASVRAEAAIGYMQMAGVDGLFLAGQLGNRRQAANQLNRAAAVLSATPEADRLDPAIVHAEGRLYLFRGLLAFEQSGDGTLALSDLSEAVARLTAAQKLLPGNPDIAADRWQARLLLAEARFDVGDPAGAVEIVKSAIADYAADRTTADLSPTTPMLIIRSFKLIGEAQAAAGTPERAEAGYREAESRLADEERTRPGRTRTLLEYADVAQLRSELRLTTEHPADALEFNQAAARRLADRLALDPDHEGLRRSADLLSMQRGRILMALGRPDDARREALTGLVGRTARHQSRPDDLPLIREWLIGLRTMADITRSSGDRSRACQFRAQAMSGLAGYEQLNPGSARFGRNERSAWAASGLVCPVPGG